VEQHLEELQSVLTWRSARLKPIDVDLDRRRAGERAQRRKQEQERAEREELHLGLISPRAV